MKILGFMAIFSFVMGVMWFFDPEWRGHRDFKRVMAQRDPVPDDELFASFFSAGEATADVPVRVRRLMAQHSEYPVESLLPDDDLTFVWYDLEVEDLIQALDREFEIQLTDSDVESVDACSIREISRLIMRKTSMTEPPKPTRADGTASESP